MTNWPLDIERELLADACVQDFETFCRVGLGFTHPKNEKGRWWSDEVHKPLCAWLQTQLLSWLASRKAGVAERRYLAILIPRNCAKSLLITRAGMLWLHLRDPELSTYIGNEKLELAEDFLSTIKRWLEGATDDHCLFNWLFGIWKGDKGRWRSDTIVHAARKSNRTEPSFGIWSPTSALTGRHPDVACMDDLVSYDALKKDANWFDLAYGNMTDLIPVIEPNGLIILVGTRYGDADPFGRSFKAHGIRSIAGHTDFEEYGVRSTGRWDVYFLSGRKARTGEPAIPTVWPEQEMRHYALTDPVKYASQVLNRPKEHNLRPLTEKQFDSMRIDTPIEELPKMVIALHGDTAFKSQKKLAAGSESALVVVGHYTEPAHVGKAVVLDCVNSMSFRAETYADLIIGKFRQWSKIAPVIAYTDEAEMAGKLGLWERYLQDRFTDAGLELPTFYSFQRHSTDKKEIRISDAIHFIVNGQVQFHNGAETLAALRDQLCGFPNSFPIDLADAFADTFQPEFFSGLLPKLKREQEEYPFSAYEQRFKPKQGRFYDTLDDMADYEREPIRGVAAYRDPSPEADSGIGNWRDPLFPLGT